VENKEQISLLFRKYLEQQHTEAELEEILRYFQLTEHDEFLIQLIEQELDKVPDSDSSLIKSIGDDVAHNLFKQTRPRELRKTRRWLPYAAAILVFFAGGVALYQYQYKSHADDNILATENIILPGSNRATITLGDGQVLTLSEDQEGIINKDDALVYTDGSTIQALESVQLVTLATPRAGQYAVTLSDGTRVWLNAVSELVYPTRFEENERSVRVKGEAYFEVAHDSDRPFIVHSDKQRIRVLGTQFNIHAYADEAIQHTTLVQGSVEVTSIETKKIFQLKPGQQAISKSDGELSIVPVEPQEYTSWKDGIIQFNGYELSEILRQLERWYDVDFGEIPAGIKSDRLFGRIQRDVPLNDVLQTLRDNYNTIQFKIDGRRIMISRQ